LPASDLLFQAANSPSQVALSRVIVVAESPGASGPRIAWRASEKSPVLIALQVEPGQQPLQALGLPQVRRQDGRGERLPLVGGPAVTHPRLLDLDGADAGLDGPLGQAAVADDLAASLVVPEVGVVVDPGGDLGLDGLGQEASSPVPEQVGEHVLAGCQGHDTDLGCTLTHGGVLLGLVGLMVCS
jgi:hypothetical protein